MVTDLYSNVIKWAVINAGFKDLSFFLTKKNPAPAGGDDGRIKPASSNAEM